MTRGHVVLSGLTHRYGSTTTLDGIDIDVPAGSFTVLVGPSGSGKSTILQLVAGLLVPAAGSVTIDARDVTAAPPGSRDLAMVFQDYALYPHMTVAQNVGFALRLDARHRRSTMSRREIDAAVAGACERLGLDGLLRRKPAQLSGGQRQRVAIARALVRQPSVLLLDEPLSAIDAQLRAQTRTELLRLHRELGATVVLVTHDQSEALSLASDLVLLDAGRIVQAGPPAEVYRRPASLTAARFLGTPAINLRPDPDRPGVTVGWRPHDAVLGTNALPGLCLEGEVELVEYFGDSHVLHCCGPGGRWALTVRESAPPPPGCRVLASVPAAALHLFDTATGMRLDGM